MKVRIDPDKLEVILRKRAIDVRERKVLIANYYGTTQEGDAASINCSGFGRIRTLPNTTRPGWIWFATRSEPAAYKLNVPLEEVGTCQVFQNAACNFRCWFCYVDDDLLNANKHAEFLSADDLLDLFLQETEQPKIIILSGGQPEITPEWTVWMMEALQKRNLHKKFYLWSDDNLSTYAAWKYLSPQQWDIIRLYENYGRQCCIKSITPEGFAENTGVHPEFFERQFDILARLIKEGIDVYVDLTLTLVSLENIEVKMSNFIDKLQRDVHPNIPLRVTPIEIRTYGPTKHRLTPMRRQALENQYTVLQVWLSELNKRFSSREIETPSYLIPLD